MCQSDILSALQDNKNRSAGLQDRPSQCGRVLKILIDAGGNWVDGMTFLGLDKPITQFHARIFELENKYKYKIESRFVENRNWKEYRIIN